MSNKFKLLLASTVTVMAVIAAPVFAAGKDKKTTADNVLTVYISAHGGSSIAKKMNEMHMTMEAKGWRYLDMEVHTENSDTEGAWITYEKHSVSTMSSD